MTENKHINPEHFAGNLTEEEIRHLAECPRCRLLFADYVETKERIRAPGHLKASILEKSREPNVALVACSNHLSRRLQFFYVSLRVGAAVLCSLTLLFLGPALAPDRQAVVLGKQQISHYEEISEEWQKQYRRVESFTGRLNELFLPDKEVSRYDEKEK